MMNDTHLRHVAVTGVACGTRPRGSLALIHDSQPQAKRQWAMAGLMLHRAARSATRAGPMRELGYPCPTTMGRRLREEALGRPGRFAA
jgi:hypothetical protein